MGLDEIDVREEMNAIERENLRAPTARTTGRVDTRDRPLPSGYTLASRLRCQRWPRYACPAQQKPGPVNQRLRTPAVDVSTGVIDEPGGRDPSIVSRTPGNAAAAATPNPHRGHVDLPPSSLHGWRPARPRPRRLQSPSQRPGPRADSGKCARPGRCLFRPGTILLPL